MDDRTESAAAAYAAKRQAFADDVASRGLGDVRDLHWYHTIDLGDGLVTPGIYDLRGCLADYRFPASMNGLSVLDAGAATGFFSFEFARRGARVVALELPSFHELDRFHNQTFEDTVRLLGAIVDGPGNEDSYDPSERAERLYDTLIAAPFEFCRTRLGWAVERRFCTVYDASAATLGTAAFDLVFAGDVLVHTLYPMKALAALASVCAGKLIIAQQLAGTSDDPPALIYCGGEDQRSDNITWWLPNFQCLRSNLRKLGFAEVLEAGYSTMTNQETGFSLKRTVVHATRG